MASVVDTNIINRLVDGRLVLEDLPSNGSFLATHVQIDEINNTRDPERRVKLLLKFAALRADLVSTESFVLGVSRLGHAKLSSDGLYTNIKDELAARDSRWRNNAHDALLAELAIKNGHILITADRHLAEVAEKYGCRIRFHAP